MILNVCLPICRISDLATNFMSGILFGADILPETEYLTGFKLICIPFGSFKFKVSGVISNSSQPLVFNVTSVSSPLIQMTLFPLATRNKIQYLETSVRASSSLTYFAG